MEEMIISNYPDKLTLLDLELMLKHKDESDRVKLIEVIRHRLNDRYLKILDAKDQENIISSFLLMAICCFLIETLECFYEAKNSTEDFKLKHYKIFRNFFKRKNNRSLSDFAYHAKDFYYNIRCGILHQAETTNGWRLNKIDKKDMKIKDEKDKEIIVDFKKRIIYGLQFYKALKICLDNYMEDLRNSKYEENNWPNAIKKLKYICNNCYPKGHGKNNILKLKESFYSGKIKEEDYIRKRSILMKGI